MRARIFSDFDGTISDKDSLKFILSRHGGDRWKLLEQMIFEGRISEREALPKMFDAFPILPVQARAEILDAVRLDPTFKTFVEWSREMRHELSILSGGFGSFIYPLLEREGLQDLPVVANDISISDSSWKIERAPAKALCDLCTHCKSSSLLEATRSVSDGPIVYIGDGHTDFCPMQLAHLVFAKSSLKKHCQEYGKDFVSFENFQDVQHLLHEALEDMHRRSAVECGAKWGFASRNFLERIAA